MRISFAPVLLELSVDIVCETVVLPIALANLERGSKVPGICLVWVLQKREERFDSVPHPHQPVLLEGLVADHSRFPVYVRMEEFLRLCEDELRRLVGIVLRKFDKQAETKIMEGSVTLHKR